MCYHRVWIFDLCGHTHMEPTRTRKCAKAIAAEREARDVRPIPQPQLESAPGPQAEPESVSDVVEKVIESQIQSREEPDTATLPSTTFDPTQLNAPNASSDLPLLSSARYQAQGRVPSVGAQQQILGPGHSDLDFEQEPRVASSIFSRMSLELESDTTVSQRSSATSRPSTTVSPTAPKAPRPMPAQAPAPPLTLAERRMQSARTSANIPPKPPTSCTPSTHPFITRRLHKLCNTCARTRAAQLAAVEDTLYGMAPRFEEEKWKVHYEKEDDQRWKLWGNKTLGSNTPTSVRTPGSARSRGGMSSGGYSSPMSPRSFAGSPGVMSGGASVHSRNSMPFGMGLGSPGSQNSPKVGSPLALETPMVNGLVGGNAQGGTIQMPLQEAEEDGIGTVQIGFVERKENRGPLWTRWKSIRRK